METVTNGTRISGTALVMDNLVASTITASAQAASLELAADKEVSGGQVLYYAVASHYCKTLFCENSDVCGFLWSSCPLHNFLKWHVFRSIPPLTHHEFGKW